jgi:hypothetical protein
LKKKKAVFLVGIERLKGMLAGKAGAWWSLAI